MLKTGKRRSANSTVEK